MPAAPSVARPRSREPLRYVYGGDQAAARCRRRCRHAVPSTEIEQYFVEASQIEPAISVGRSRYDELDVWMPGDDGFGAAIDEMLLGLEGRCEALVMVPWIGIGGADIVSANYLRALSDDPRFDGKVSALATYLPERTRSDMIPPGVNFVQADQALRTLSPVRQEHLFAQLVVWAKPRLVLGVNCFDLVKALRTVPRPRLPDRSVYLTLFAFDKHRRRLSGAADHRRLAARVPPRPSAGSSPTTR